MATLPPTIPAGRRRSCVPTATRSTFSSRAVPAISLHGTPRMSRVSTWSPAATRATSSAASCSLRMSERTSVAAQPAWTAAFMSSTSTRSSSVSGSERRRACRTASIASGVSSTPQRIRVNMCPPLLARRHRHAAGGAGHRGCLGFSGAASPQRGLGGPLITRSSAAAAGRPGALAPGRRRRHSGLRARRPD